jgi:hypothetical protein
LSHSFPAARLELRRTRKAVHESGCLKKSEGRELRRCAFLSPSTGQNGPFVEGLGTQNNGVVPSSELGTLNCEGAQL